MVYPFMLSLVTKALMPFTLLQVIWGNTTDLYHYRVCVVVGLLIDSQRKQTDAVTIMWCWKFFHLSMLILAKLKLLAEWIFDWKSFYRKGDNKYCLYESKKEIRTEVLFFFYFLNFYCDFSCYLLNTYIMIKIQSEYF